MNKLVKQLLLGAATALCSLAALAQPATYGNAGQEAPSNSFISTADGPLMAYYTGWSGGLTVLVGLQTNGVDGPAGLSNHGSVEGDSFVLGNVSAGQSLVFFIDVTDTNTNDTVRYYSDKALSPDHVNHAWALAYAGDANVPAGLHIAFEDLAGGGDFNYHDHGIVVQNVLAVPSPVPEPASWALLLCGAAGMAMLRRRRD